MQYKFIINKEELNSHIYESVQKTKIVFIVKECLEVIVLYLISIVICRKYFNGKTDLYMMFLKYITFLSVIIMFIILLKENKRFTKYMKLELLDNGVYYFLDNEITIGIEEEGLYVKDNIKETTYYWNMIEGYYESKNHIYMGDRLENIIAIIPVNKLGIEKSKIIYELEKYTQKSDKLNKKCAILKNALNKVE
ncbi:hypothetical protein ACOAKC_12185 [Hathewaya histolytica]|uniref:hypothetical protein n=1 Tax=Hathewaya histolytica TaxID=1498 RepID=UPI003B66CE90